MKRLNSLKALAIVFLLVSFSTAAVSANGRAGQETAKPSAVQLPSIPPRELIQRVINNELKASQEDNTHYMYEDRRQTASGSKTKMMVETTQGTVAYLLAVNDKPLDAQQRTDENQRLKLLLSSAEQQNKKKKEQQQDNDRVARMFKQLPNAFIYKYDGMIPGNNGHEWVKLTFEPDANYDPPSREAAVFKAMSGTMVVDPTSERLAKIQATLFKDVNFGWGILGHLDKGGHFFVEQNNIGDDRWEPTYMNIEFTGKALLFKTISLHQIESTSDYVRVPDNLTLAQGVEMLRKHADGVLAENTPGGKK